MRTKPLKKPLDEELAIDYLYKYIRQPIKNNNKAAKKSRSNL